MGLLTYFMGKITGETFLFYMHIHIYQSHHHHHQLPTPVPWVWMFSRSHFFIIRQLSSSNYSQPTPLFYWSFLTPSFQLPLGQPFPNDFVYDILLDILLIPILWMSSKPPQAPSLYSLSHTNYTQIPSHFFFLSLQRFLMKGLQPEVVGWNPKEYENKAKRL